MVRRDDKETQALILCVEWSLSFAYLFLQYYMTHPTEWNLLKMRLALAGKHEADKMVEFCDGRRDRWQRSATWFAQWYNEMRP